MGGKLEEEMPYTSPPSPGEKTGYQSNKQIIKILKQTSLVHGGILTPVNPALWPQQSTTPPFSVLRFFNE